MHGESNLRGYQTQRTTRILYLEDQGTYFRRGSRGRTPPFSSIKKVKKGRALLVPHVPPLSKILANTPTHPQGGDKILDLPLFCMPIIIEMHVTWPRGLLPQS